MNIILHFILLILISLPQYDLKECLQKDSYYDDGELDVVVDLVMHFGDSNHDGKLSYIEFLEMLEKPDCQLR